MPTEELKRIKAYKRQTWVIKFGSMNKGKRNTAKSERDVNALAGVKFPPSKVYTPNETTVTTTGMLFSINLLHCKTREKVSTDFIKDQHYNCGSSY